MATNTRFNDTIRKDHTKFNFKQFFGLIKRTSPKYVLLFLGVFLLAISSGVQVYVPKLASTLVNNFSKGVDYVLLGKVVLLFCCINYFFSDWRHCVGDFWGECYPKSP